MMLWSHPLFQSSAHCFHSNNQWGPLVARTALCLPALIGAAPAANGRGGELSVCTVQPGMCSTRAKLAKKKWRCWLSLWRHLLAALVYCTRKQHMFPFI